MGPGHLRSEARTRCATRIASGLLLLAAVAPEVAWAQAAPIKLELNRLEPREGGCRVWMVANNPDKQGLDPVRLDVVLFGHDGVAGRRLAVDIGPLPAGRTAVRLFDVTAQPCDGIGQVLMNDVLACGGAELAQRTACADRLAPSSRVAGVPFEK